MAKIKDIAKAGTCVVVASATALSGTVPATAIASTQPAEKAPVNTVLVQDDSAQLTLEEAKAALDQATEESTELAKHRDAMLAVLENAKAAHETAAAEHSDSVAVTAEKQNAVDQRLADAIESVRPTVEDAVAAKDSAQAAYDDALAQRDIAEQARDKAEQRLADAKRAYENALSQASDANKPYLEQVDQAQSAVDEADANHAAASKNLGNTRADLDSKTAQYETAQSALAEARAAQTTQEARLADANTQLANAKAALEAIESADDEKYAAAQAQVSAATTKVSQAETALAQAKANLKNAQDSFTQAQTAKSAAQTAYDQALSEYNAIDVETARQDLAIANADLTVEQATADDLAEKVQAAKQALQDAQDEYNAANKDFEAANLLVTETSRNLEEAKERLIDTQGIVYNLNDFMQDQYEQATDLEIIDLYNSDDYQQYYFRYTGNKILAYFDTPRLQKVVNENGKTDYVERPEINAATEFDNEHDATSHVNVLKSLESIRNLLALRESLGLNSNLPVSDYMMVSAALSANWSSNHFEHAPGQAGAEVLSWGRENPLNGWYVKEKEIYEECQRTGMWNGITLPDNWEQMNYSEMQAFNNDWWIAIGHYLIVTDPDLRFCGAAYVDKEDTLYGNLWGNQYSYVNWGDYCLPVDEWEARFLNWIAVQRVEEGETGKEISENYLDAVQAKTDALNALLALQESSGETDPADAEKVSQAQAALKEAEEAYADQLKIVSEKQTTKDNAQTLFDAVSADEQDALKKLNETSQALKEATEALEEAEAALNDGELERLVGEKEGTLSDANEELTSAQEALEKIDSNSQERQAAEAAIEEATALSAKESDELTKANSQVAEAVRSSDELLLELGNLEKQLQENRTALQTAFEELEAARDDLERANQSLNDNAGRWNGIIQNAYDYVSSEEYAFESAQEDFETLDDAALECALRIEDATRELERTSKVLNALEDLIDTNILAARLEDEVIDLMGDCIAELRFATEQEAKTQSALEEALSSVDKAQADYDLAQSEYSDSVSKVVAAQITYDQLLAESENENKGENPGDNTGDTPGENPGNTPEDPSGETPGNTPGETPTDTPNNDQGNSSSETPGNTDQGNQTSGSSTSNSNNNPNGSANTNQSSTSNNSSGANNNSNQASTSTSAADLAGNNENSSAAVSNMASESNGGASSVSNTAGTSNGVKQPSSSNQGQAASQNTTSTRTNSSAANDSTANDPDSTSETTESDDPTIATAEENIFSDVTPLASYAETNAVSENEAANQDMTSWGVCAALAASVIATGAFASRKRKSKTSQEAS